VVADEQAPLVTTALKAVDAVKAPVANAAPVAPDTALHVGEVAVQFVDFCHTIDPVDPANVKVVPVFGEHKLFVPVIVPDTETGLVVITKLEVVADEHAPLVNTALKAVDTGNAAICALVNVEAVAPVIAVHVGEVAVQFVDFCHTIDPVDPVRVKAVPVFGIHKASVPEIVPATDG
jgi:hypothetical protein